MKLLMLVPNSFENDARVNRTAIACAELGLTVTVLARKKIGLPDEETLGKFHVLRRSFVPVGRLRKIRLTLIRIASRIIDWLIRRLFSDTSGQNKIRSVLEQIWAGLALKRHQEISRGMIQCVLEVADEIDPDLIHAHDFDSLLAAYEVWMQRSIPYVYDSHELWVERNRNGLPLTCTQKNWEVAAEQRAIAQAKFTITVCDSIADHLAAAYQIPRPIVIRNTPLKRQTGGRPKNIRSALGLSPSDFLAVYVGKATHNRGVLDILRALPNVDRHVKFIVLGYFDSRFRIIFDALVTDLQLADRVFTFGPVPANEVSAWVKECDLSLTTMNQSCLSYLYTLPNKLFESLQGGVPVIGPDSPEIIRITGHYDCGLTYQDGNAADLASKINQVLLDPNLAGRLRHGAERAAEELCWEREQERLFAAYQKHFPQLATTPAKPEAVQLSAIS